MSNTVTVNRHSGTTICSPSLRVRTNICPFSLPGFAHIGNLCQDEQAPSSPTEEEGAVHVGGCEQSSLWQPACRLPAGDAGKFPECCVQRTCRNARTMLARVKRPLIA